MKLDLRKDKGILRQSKFIADESSIPEISEDELIAETMRRRRTSHQSEESLPEAESTQPTRTEKSETTSTSRNRNPVRELVLLILMVSVTIYYLNDKGILFSTVDMARDYAYDLLGIDPVLPPDEDDDLDQYEQYFSGDSLIFESSEPDTILSDDVFNELMPITPDIAALAESLETVPPESLEMATPESLYVQLPGGRDTVIVYQEFTQVSEDVNQLSDDDIAIINNRSLLLMVTEMISGLPFEYGEGNLFLKRDALTVTAPRGGEWVGELQSILDKFVQGSFIEDYSTGTAKIQSKFELVMNAEQDFEGQSFDAMRLLDILANPFNEYLEEIVIDPALDIDNNPVELSFSGSAQEMQFILSSWAESRSNYLLKSIDMDFNGEALYLQIGVIFFTYTP